MLYVLPWGQMSYWGAAVITNLFSVISDELVYFIWGGFSVANATLNRFFSLHYLLPFILTGLVLLHLLSLHQNASNNPDGIESLGDRIRFHPYFTSKDLVGFIAFFLIFSIVIFYYPNVLGHPDNSIMANPLVTPHSIQPEWYYLPFYAILRAVPNKTLGVVALFASILILALLPLSKKTIRSNRYKPIMKVLYFFFVFNFFFLLW
jgi:ubiquinol-cytochrome c reductase cytochrome b subunit